jgi:hypothetical protein
MLNKKRIPSLYALFSISGILIVPFSYIISGNLTPFILFSFSVIVLIFVWIISNNEFQIQIPKTRTSLLTSFFILYSLGGFLLYGHYDLDYIKPTFFFLFLFLYNLVEENGFSFRITRKIVLAVFIVHLLTSYLVYMMELEGLLERTYIHRFMGIHISPTTFALYTSGFFIFACSSLKNNYLKLFLYLATFFLIQSSATRINVVFFVGLFPLFFLNWINVRNKLVLFTGFVVIMFTYPIFMAVEGIANAAIGREEDSDNESGSTAERLFILGEQIKVIQNSNTVQHFFGQGPESCYDIFDYLNNRPEVSKRVKDGRAGWTHFDFTRIYIEFGFVFTLLYFYYLFYNFSITKLTSLLLLNYFISYYHNAYNDPLNFLILLSGRYIIIED